MTDYRDSTPLHFNPPTKEFRGDGEPLYPDKWPEFVEETETQNKTLATHGE